MEKKFTLKQLHDAIENLHARKGFHRAVLLDFLVSFYKEDTDVKTVKKIDTVKIVEQVYGPPPKEKKAYKAFLKENRKKYSSLKSSLNTSFRELYKKGLNPKRVGVNRSNAFGYLPESKDEIIKKLSLSLDVLSSQFLDPSKDVKLKDLDTGDLIEKIKSISELEKQATTIREQLEKRIEEHLAEGSEGEGSKKMSSENYDVLKELGLAAEEKDGLEGKAEGRKEGEEGDRESDKSAGKEDGSLDDGEGKKGDTGTEQGKIGDTGTDEGREGLEGKAEGRKEGEEGDRESEKAAGKEDGSLDDGEGKKGDTGTEQGKIGDTGKDEGREGLEGKAEGRKEGEEGEEGDRESDKSAGKEDGSLNDGEGKKGDTGTEQEKIGDTGKDEGREGLEGKAEGRKEGEEGDRESEKAAGKEDGSLDDDEGKKGDTGSEQGNVGDTGEEEGKDGLEGKAEGRKEGEEGDRESDKSAGKEDGSLDEGEGKKGDTGSEQGKIGETGKEEGKGIAIRKGKDLGEEEDWVKGKSAKGDAYEELSEEEKKWLEEKRAKKENEKKEEKEKKEEEERKKEEEMEEIAFQEEEIPQQDTFTDGEFEEGHGSGSGEIRKPLGRMIEVRKGHFTFGCDEGDIAFRPEKIVELEGFQIGQYPINNYQFSKFIEKTDYVTEAEIENKSWVFSGLVWNRVVEMDEDGFEDERIIYQKGSLNEVEGANWKHPSGPLSSIETSMDCPVVHVSLKDVLEFLNWRSQVTGKYFRLPTEMEWEKAARGSEGLIYPWGNEWDASKCNSFESKTNGITDVDVYQNDSPYNINDLIGNVWEWTLGRETPLTHEEALKQLTVKDRKDYPALKGGSWMSSRENMKAYTKVKYQATMRSNFIGFRCSRSLNGDK